jgi:hypothetical protein
MRALKSDTTAQDDVDDVGLRYMSDHALKKSEYNVSYLFAPSHTSNHVTYLPGRIMVQSLHYDFGIVAAQ